MTPKATWRDAPSTDPADVADVVLRGQYLSPQQAAVFAQLSPRTVLKAIRQGKLVAARVGNRVRIRPDALRAWLERAEGGSRR